MLPTSSRTSRRVRAALLAVALGVVAGCSGPPAAPTVDDAQARVVRDPTNPVALRDLGIMLLRDGQLGAAQEALRRSFDHAPDDPATVYFLGITQEALGRTDLALQLYEQYPRLDRRSPYREKLRGRYVTLLRDEARAEIRAALAAEDSIGNVAGTGAVAVIPFLYGGGDDQYAPLGRGLAELTAGDLAGIEGVTVVERIRLQALLSEFELARRGALDPSTAPRLGRLVQAERIAGGAYTIDRQQIRVDGALFDGQTGTDTELDPAEGALSNLLRVQDALVYELLAALGVDPTAADRARIDRVPTENLQAFLAYSRALEAEDAGDLPLAARLFGQAAALDPGFSEAAQRQAEAEAAEDQAGPATEVATAEAIAATTTSSASNHALNRRSEALARTLGAALVPGADTREPAVEGSRAGIFGPLPAPPPPPSTDT